MEEARDDVNRARLLASATKESGAWLHALPIASLGLRMDDDTIRIAVGLRLGVPICGHHMCRHCGAEVDSMGRHSLSCRSSEGRHHRHGASNEIIHRSLVSAHVPSRLEPQGFMRSEETRWEEARWCHNRTLEVWEATGMGCRLPRYFCAVLHQPGNHCGRGSSSPS